MGHCRLNSDSIVLIQIQVSKIGHLCLKSDTSVYIRTLVPKIGRFSLNLDTCLLGPWGVGFRVVPFRNIPFWGLQYIVYRTNRFL